MDRAENSNDSVLHTGRGHKRKKNQGVSMCKIISVYSQFIMVDSFYSNVARVLQLRLVNVWDKSQLLLVLFDSLLYLSSNYLWVRQTFLFKKYVNYVQSSLSSCMLSFPAALQHYCTNKPQQQRPTNKGLRGSFVLIPRSPSLSFLTRDSGRIREDSR